MTKIRNTGLVTLFLMLWLLPVRAAENLDGENLYQEHCAMCHSDPQDGRTPSRSSLNAFTANSIFQALTDGVMAPQGNALSNGQKIALAEHLTGTALQLGGAENLARCEASMPTLDLADARNWNGWGNGITNTRHQSSAGTRISADNIGELELVWAMGLDNASAARAQPSVIGDVLILGSPSGAVQALDIATGCAYWTFLAPREVRAAVQVAWSEGHGTHIGVVADISNHIHVIDVHTGNLLWDAQVDDNPFARSLGSPVIHEGRIYVPVSSTEVSAAGRPDHHCCTFRGNMAAFDMNTGERLWHTYVMEEPQHVGENSVGNPVYAPSGAPIWQAPSLDPARRTVYAGTGQNYSRPASHTSDSVIAFDMDSGEMKWVYQTTGDDQFIMGCASPQHPNCPEPGPDLDIGSPIVVTQLSNGQDIVVAGTKGGELFALDPDRNGALLWQSRVGRGGALGGIHWGMSFDGDVLYVPVSDREALSGPTEAQAGLHAIDLKTGAELWYAPAPQRCQEGAASCMDAYSAPASSTDDLVITGSLSGYLFAHDRDTGELLWEYNTVRDYETVNGVAARGGAIDATGPVLSGDYMIVSTGYATFGQLPGNAVLVFRLGR